MIRRATFGEFIQAAHWHLDPATTIHGSAAGRGSAEEVSRSLLRVLTVMRRYAEDLSTAFNNMPSQPHPELGTWPHTAIEVRQALRHSAGFLHPNGAVSRWPSVPAASPLARRLDSVAESLITGRDLLQTHFSMGPYGERGHRSEWAVVITSPTITRALLVEIGQLSRAVARQSADVALTGLPGSRDSAEARRALNAACQWLWILNASVQAAHQRDPASPADNELLRAIPVNIAPPRHLPDGSESVTALCEGTIATTERLRHLAWDAAELPPWASGMSVASMYQVAAASTATSYNCEVLLRSLAVGMGRPAAGQISAQLSAAADAAGRTRERWLAVAHALDNINTDTTGQISHAAAEARDLVLWTGRLAYADPEWTPASGPTQTARRPESVASAQVPLVVATAHHVGVALTRLARAERDQIRTAAQAGRILVTTRSLPESFDIPRPFARAPQARVERLLSRYRHAEDSSRQVTAEIASAAETAGAPSRVLNAAAAAVNSCHVRTPDKDKMPNGFAEADVRREHDDRPGPVESTLLQLGVSRPDVLRRGADIDQASSRLIIDAANELDPSQRRPDATVLGRSAGSAEVVNHALASGGLRAAALLRQPSPPERESPEPEP